MKKSVIVGICFFLTHQILAKKIEGSIIFPDNRAEQVTFSIPVNFLSQEVTFAAIQYKLKYFDKTGRKMTLKPSQAKEIQFVYDGETIRMISLTNSLGMGSIFNSDPNIFLKLEADGPLRLFKFFQKQQSTGFANPTTGMMTGGYAYTIENYVMQKREGILMRPTGISFRKDMTAYFSDCPSLVDKIQQKEFRRGDMEQIVMEYNRNCASQLK